MKIRVNLLIAFVSLFIFTLLFSSTVLAEEIESPESALQNIYDKRSNAFITGDISSFKEYYDTSQKFGQWALEHEVKRIQYLNSWAKERNMKFNKIQTSIRVNRKRGNENRAILAVEETYKFDYSYPEKQDNYINSFGVGIRHSVNMIRKQDKWIIYNDWYTDCFEDALKSYSGDINAKPFETENNNADKVYIDYKWEGELSEKRLKAVSYADKYCGAAWGSGNNYKYNKQYMDYNGAGGDCTNFVSQALGDKKEGAALHFRNGWYCEMPKHGRGSGSKAWVNTDAFMSHLIYSGIGHMIKKGTYAQIIKNNTDSYSIFDNIMPGDIIAYEKKGNVDHFAIVTSKDSNGYPLVNSHTTDRYHVPWDLGWGDNGIKFCIIHGNY